MKTNHRFFQPAVGSSVRIIGTQAIGTVELFDLIKTSEGAELFAKIRYKNRLTRFSRVSDLGVTLPKCLRFLYPVFDDKKSFWQVVKSELSGMARKLERFFERFFASNLDRVLLAICILIAATLIIVFTLK